MEIARYSTCKSSGSCTSLVPTRAMKTAKKDISRSHPAGLLLVIILTVGGILEYRYHTIEPGSPEGYFIHFEMNQNPM